MISFKPSHASVAKLVLEIRYEGSNVRRAPIESWILYLNVISFVKSGVTEQTYHSFIGIEKTMAIIEVLQEHFG